MSKQKLSILEVVKKGGISSKTGRPWEIFAAQCVLEQDIPGEPRLLVGTVNLHKDLKDTEPGEYLASLSLYQSSEGRIESRITSLTPFGRPTAKPKADAAVV